MSTKAKTPPPKPATTEGSGTKMRLGWTRVCEPVGLDATRLTLYVPGVVYWWLGFWLLDMPVSPKAQLQPVGVCVDRSVARREAQTLGLPASSPIRVDSHRRCPGDSRG